MYILLNYPKKGDLKWQLYFQFRQPKADSWLPAWQTLLKVSIQPWYVHLWLDVAFM